MSDKPSRLTGSARLKRVVLSTILGCIIVVIIFLIAQIPSNGPTPIVIVILPFAILASAITDDRFTGEIVFYLLQVGFYGALWYLAIGGFAVFRTRHKP